MALSPFDNVYHCCTQKTASQWFRGIFADPAFADHTGLEEVPFVLNVSSLPTVPGGARVRLSVEGSDLVDVGLRLRHMETLAEAPAEEAIESAEEIPVEGVAQSE